jgi:hypothetical protein
MVSGKQVPQARTCGDELVSTFWGYEPLGSLSFRGGQQRFAPARECRVGGGARVHEPQVHVTGVEKWELSGHSAIYFV